MRSNALKCGVIPIVVSTLDDLTDIRLMESRHRLIASGISSDLIPLTVAPRFSISRGHR